MYYLGSYTAGDAKKAINGYIVQNTADTYKTAKENLVQRYGNPFEVAKAYRKKIHVSPKTLNNVEKLNRYWKYLKERNIGRFCYRAANNFFI